MSQFLAYLKCYFQMTFNTVTPALASPPPAYSIGFLHFLKLATSIPIQTSSTNKKSASDIYGMVQSTAIRCIWHIWPFKFCGYYYLNRFSIRHANPINPTLFERLVITIFALTGATPKKKLRCMQLFCSIQKIYWFLLSTWHYSVSIFWFRSNVSIFWFCSIYSLRWFLISIRILAWTQMNHLGKNGDKNLIRNPWWKTRVFSDDELGGEMRAKIFCVLQWGRLTSRFCLAAPCSKVFFRF